MSRRHRPRLAPPPPKITIEVAISPRLLRIANRDFWVCHLCGLPVPREFEPNSNLAPSLDHLIPQEHGGSDNELTNLALAHRWCNERRGSHMMSDLTEEMFEGGPFR